MLRMAILSFLRTTTQVNILNLLLDNRQSIEFMHNYIFQNSEADQLGRQTNIK